MQDATFRTTLQEIRTLHETEGPHTNIFANKFKAREKLFELRRVLLESLPKAVELNEDAKQSSVMLTQIQLCEVYLMIGNNLYETEEEKEALQTLLRTYRMLLDALREAAYSYAEEPTYELEALLTTSNLIAPNAETATPEDYTHIGLHLDVLNSIAIVLSSRDQRQRIEDARIVLHYAESLYCSWDEWAKRNSIPYATRELDAPQPDGKDGGEDTPELEAWRTRDRCEKAYTITVFYLAQTYGGSDTVQASKYCHYTLARQLISRKEFSHKEWATNALHLSGFYLSEEDYPSAMYFIDAAIVVAPTKDSPRGATDEDIDEIQANIQLAIARMYRFILQQSEMRLEASHGRSDKEQDCDAVGPRPDRVKISSWWVDLALPQIVKKKPEEFAYAATFEQARKYFLIALDNFNTAAKNYYVLSGMCTDHIQIQMDISDLYKVLVPFEKDVDRKCAMHARRAQALEELPDRLNPQAYHTYIQKLCFELGEIYSDILDIRLGCRSQSKTSETASTNNKGTPGRVSDKKLRELGEKSKAYYIRFVEAFNLRETGRLPSDFDKELHPTYIRALMRIARMETRAPATDPKSEYDAIQRSLDRYKGVLQFVGQYKVTDPSLHHELEICREMTILLPGKMKEVWKVFHKICN